MYARLRKIASASAFSIIAFAAMGQVTTGTYPFGTFDKPGFDTINVGNLNVDFAVPVLNKAGRGMPFYYALAYNSSIWTPTVVSGSTLWQPSPAFGWSANTNVLTGFVQYSSQRITCSYYGDNGKLIHSPGTYFYHYSYTDVFGATHPYQSTGEMCPSSPNNSDFSFLETASDGSGYTISVDDTEASVTTRAGITFNPPINNTKGAGIVTDSNGNEISTANGGTFIDTTGGVALTVAGSGSPSSPMTFTYTDTNGTQRIVSMTYRSYMVQTAFGCSGVGEYGPTQTSLVDTITYPDGSTYHFSYEATPGGSGNVTGRIAGVQLPPGNTIQYSYSGGNNGNGIECSDGSTAGLTRKLNGDSGSAASTWTYSRTMTGAGTSSTAVVDGLGNNKSYTFVEANNQPAATTAAYYETSRSVYQGSSGTAVVARNTCYNGATSPCATSQFALPISQVDTYETLDGIQMHGARTKFNSYGSQTESDIYDFGGASSRGAVLRKEIWTYGYTIPGLVTVDAIYDGNGNPAGETLYTYDGNTPTASSGVPQHVAVIGARGNLTSVNQYASSGVSYQSSATYEDTGSLLTVRPRPARQPLPTTPPLSTPPEPPYQLLPAVFRLLEVKRTTPPILVYR